MISVFQLIIRLTLSVVFGSLIGLERELRQKQAGLKTHVLVSLGSCLIMLTSLYIFDIYRDIADLDPARIAAGVVTGIGFLGAGAIIRYGVAVKGLTTAACLWIAAAVGLATGCGFYTAAFTTVILVVVVLWLLRRIETSIVKKK